MPLTAGATGTNQTAYIVLDAQGNVVRSHNLTFSATPTNNADAVIQAISSRYKAQREIPLTNGGVILVMSIL